jgi:single-stranded-DNA-specific exonuclease
MQVKQRNINLHLKEQLIENGSNQFLASILAARNIGSPDETNYDLKSLLPPSLMHSIESAAEFLYESIKQEKKIIIIGDYDADGATASAVAVLGLRKFLANVDFLVPNRFVYGYGLSEGIVKEAMKNNPDVIITVDNGIASIDGVSFARANNIDVIVTDHHLQAEQLPEANFIINPNQRDCSFPSKNLCGAGVVFYLLLALRVVFRSKGEFKNTSEPNLLELIDLVCLGTVADLVPLDFNNRILVQYGMKKIRQNACNYGIQAIAKLSNKSIASLKTSDLSFSIAPKLNAAGRLDDMSIGIKCLLAQSYAEAEHFALELMKLNAQRKEIELEMKEDVLDNLSFDKDKSYSLCLYNKNWHQGVIGILASRMKEKYHRPTIIFALDSSGIFKGSARSIPGFHMRDALDLISKQHTHLIKTFGGHAMAAGLTIEETSFDEFVTVFELHCAKTLTKDDLNLVVDVDESILAKSVTFEDVRQIGLSVWGQGFSPPYFKDGFEVISQKTLMNKHVKCQLLLKSKIYEAIIFNYVETLPDRIVAVYSMETNDFRGNKSIQLILRELV